MKPEALSRALREDSTPELDRRRAIVALSLVSAGSMGLITLYQMGLIRHLPELPLPYLDADTVDASPEAYAKLSSPDAPLGLASYAITLVLATIGGPERARTLPLIPLALAAKATLDALQAGRLTVDQWVRHRAFCSWCLLATGATFTVLPLTFPEARDAWRMLREQGLGQTLSLLKNPIMRTIRPYSKAQKD